MKIVYTFLLFLSCIYLQAQTNISGIINSYAQVTTVYYSCPDSLQLSSTSGFSVGDSIIIIQMQGAVIESSNSNLFGTILDYDKAGNFEVVKIGSINGNVINLTSSLMNLYDVAGNVQIVSYPSFTNAIVTSTLTAQAWNGSTGGILAFAVLDSLILNADIDLTGTGFSGGNVSQNYTSSWFIEYAFDSLPGNGGGKGEGIAEYITYSKYGRAAQANGGGGGMDVNTGAAGGGNYGAGGHGGNNSSAPDTLWGLSGLSLGSAILQNKIFLGGGGGGGHQDNGQGTSGSNGGGIIFIRATTASGNNFSIKSNGADVTVVAGTDGAGGGGGGGSVLLNVSYFDTNIFIEAKGGKGGDQVSPIQCHGNGGGGGGGVVLFADTAVPVNVFSSVSGGPKGIGDCNSTPNAAADGDSGIVRFSWSIPQVVTANAGPDVSVCAGTLIQIGTTAQTGSIYSWSNGSGGATQLISSLIDTLFVVTVTDGFCHYSYDTVRISVWPNPVPLFTFNVNCSNVVFNNNSGPNVYKWYFGDGDSSSAVSPSHNYQNSGNFTVNLSITDNNGCMTTVNQAITINTNQQPSMSYNNGNCDSIFHFINQSINPVLSRWKFGDGDSSNLLHPYHTYNRSGNMQVQMISTSQNGCVDTVNQSVYVVIRTPAKFDYYIDSCAAKVLFTSKSPLSVAYNWDFGDNANSSTANPVHSYQQMGEYNVTLTVNSGTVCYESMTTIVNSPIDGLYTLYIPNTFTPNDDGTNDEFKIFSKIPCDSYTLIIYNRWGEAIFRTDDPLNIGWDGTQNGLSSAEGVYAFYLQGTKSQKMGFVVLSR